MLGDELTELSKQHGFKIVNILADEQVEGFENGRLDGEMIKRLVPDVLEREAFLCGPPPMTQALRGALKDMGLASQFVHYEKFAL
jgi:ferredoxin-NADP reductase